ncbi:MAG: peptidase U32 family protein [Candidatus Hydrothermarchaeales archaeon]
MVELVVPTPNLEVLKAALDSGADSVYVPITKKVSIRFGSSFFSLGEMEKAVGYAHDLGKKAYVVVNAHVRDRGLEDFQRTVESIYSAEADGVVVSSFGVIDWINKHYPIKIIASGVASAISPEDALFLKSLGVTRVIIPRLRSLQSIKEYKEKTNMEVEVYVSGFICSAWDGKRCFLPSLLYDVGTESGLCIPKDVKRVSGLYLAGDHPIRSVRLGTDSFSTRHGSVGIEGQGLITPCIGDYIVKCGDDSIKAHLMEFEVQCDLAAIPYLIKNNVDSLKVVAEVKSLDYIKKMVEVWRKAIDAYEASPESWKVEEGWIRALQAAYNLPIRLDSYFKGGC